MAGLGLIGSAMAGAAVGAGDFANNYLAKSNLQDEAVRAQKERDSFIAKLAQQTHAANAAVDTTEAVNRETQLIPVAVGKANALIAPEVSRTRALIAPKVEETTQVGAATNKVEAGKPRVLGETLVVPGENGAPPAYTEGTPGMGAAKVGKTNAETTYLGAHSGLTSAQTDAAIAAPTRQADTERRQTASAMLDRGTKLLHETMLEEKDFAAREENMGVSALRAKKDKTPDEDKRLTAFDSKMGEFKRLRTQAQALIADGHAMTKEAVSRAAGGGQRGGPQGGSPPPASAFYTGTQTPAPAEVVEKPAPTPPPPKPKGIIDTYMRPPMVSDYVPQDTGKLGEWIRNHKQTR